MSRPLLTAAEVRARLAAASASAPAAPGADPVRRRLRQTVALSDAFAAVELTGASTEDVSAFVVDDCERVVTGSHGAWRLHHSTRVETIAEIGRADAILAAARVRENDPVGQTRAACWPARWLRCPSRVRPNSPPCCACSAG